MRPRAFARYIAGGADDPLQLPREGDEELICRQVAEPVVYRLEVVEIDVDHGEVRSWGRFT